MHRLASRPRVRNLASSLKAASIGSLAGAASIRSSSTRPRSMMRPSRPATVPIMADTAVRTKTGATASWMPWLTVLRSVAKNIAFLSCWGARGLSPRPRIRSGAIRDPVPRIHWIAGQARNDNSASILALISVCASSANPAPPRDGVM